MFRCPVQVDIDITHACNLQCIHCSADAGKPLNNELKKEELFILIDKLYDWGVMNITLAGGEPLIRLDCLEILEYALQKRGMMVTLVTNGILLSDLMLEKMAKWHRGFQLLISLDASNQELYDQIRFGAKLNFYEYIIQKIEKASELEISYGVSYVLTKLNLNDFITTYENLNSKGINKFVLIKFIPVGRGMINRDKLELTYDEWKKIILHITYDKEKGQYEKMAVSVACPNDLYRPLMEEGYTEEEVETIWGYVTPLKVESYKKFRELGCHAGITNLSIGANGDVYPCAIGMTYEQLICGNIRKQSIDKIWEHSTVLKQLRDMNLNDIEGSCFECDYRKICGGGCRIRSFAKSGRLTTKDYACSNYQ